MSQEKVTPPSYEHCYESQMMFDATFIMGAPIMKEN